MIWQDDIGDKSVFIFQALPEAEKQNVAMRLQEQNGRDPTQN